MSGMLHITIDGVPFCCCHPAEVSVAIRKLPVKGAYDRRWSYSQCTFRADSCGRVGATDKVATLQRLLPSAVVELRPGDCPTNTEGDAS